MVSLFVCSKISCLLGFFWVVTSLALDQALFISLLSGVPFKLLLARLDPACSVTINKEH